ncbi:MAG: ATP-binding protein [Gemmataceae bacterium]
MPRLLIIKGTDEGKQFELSTPLLGIGRDAENPIRLHDTEVSRRHAEFVLTEDGYKLKDIGSANGTFVNNIKITEQSLKAGDQIQIGQTVLVYSAGRTEAQQHEQGDLAEQINLISRHDMELSSAIIKTIAATEGSQILAHPEKAKTPWLRTALANLKIMYETSQAISHILDLEQLLDKILELIFNSIAADRGCVMLAHPDTGEFEPKAVRWREKVVEGQRMAVSSTIIEYVRKEMQGVLVSDASQDERFNTGQSIVRFGIREVICVPMKGRHETIGVLYLDTRSKNEVAQRKTSLGKFTEDHLALAIAIAHQAALAVEGTRYYQAMVQAERLAAIGQTIAALSHSIKNILQGLKSGGEILEMGLKDPAKNETLLQQGWKIVQKNQDKVFNLVKDMLSYSKEREPTIEHQNINELIRDVFDLINPRAVELGIQLKMSVDEGIPEVQCDPEGILHALLNIVTNAIDAVEGLPDPQVVIGTRRDKEPGWVLLIARDNGSGIPEETLNDIFKPFVSSKGSKGTGLGLAVSRKILREHGGDILVESKLQVGSKFSLRLPIRSPLSLDLTSDFETIQMHQALREEDIED